MIYFYWNSEAIIAKVCKFWFQSHRLQNINLQECCTVKPIFCKDEMKGFCIFSWDCYKFYSNWLIYNIHTVFQFVSAIGLLYIVFSDRLSNWVWHDCGENMYLIRRGWPCIIKRLMISFNLLPNIITRYSNAWIDADKLWLPGLFFQPPNAYLKKTNATSHKCGKIFFPWCHFQMHAYSCTGTHSNMLLGSMSSSLLV